MLGLVDLINDCPVHLNKYFDWAQKKIKELNRVTAKLDSQFLVDDPAD
ncbi:hypothetical protein [Lactobacillus helveticus]|nr:hypothetical protein [Lactobacillus helveticus]